MDARNASAPAVALASSILASSYMESTLLPIAAAAVKVTTDDSDNSLALSEQLSQFERLVWIAVFTVVVLIAAGGNTIVIHIVCTNKQMKSVTNYFLVNLSLADTMVSILNVVFNFISMLNSHWPFGLVYCKISNFIAILSISASVFTLTAISCDRYNAILHPLRPRMMHARALAWITLIWISSAALAMPNAIYSQLVIERVPDDEQLAITCAMIWPDGRYPLSKYDHIYNIVLFVTTYFVPITTMAILYYKVGRELWGSEAIGENVERQLEGIQAKKKIVKMMIVVVIIFALCWFPYHAFFVFNFYFPNYFQDVPLQYQRSYLLMYLLAMSNSMYNPIVIYFMNSKFRKEFKRILRVLCCCPSKSNAANGSSNAETVNRPNHYWNTKKDEFKRFPKLSEQETTTTTTTTATISTRLSQLECQNGPTSQPLKTAFNDNDNCISSDHCNRRQPSKQGEECEPFLDTKQLSEPQTSPQQQLIDQRQQQPHDESVWI